MTSLDTNVVVRLLVNDDHDQAVAARKIVDEGAVFVCTTVLLELDWVLRSLYDFSRSDVANAIRAFAGLPGVEVEAPHRLALALKGAAAGMDLADCLHLLAREDMDFVTFDKKLAKASRTQGIGRVRPM